MKNTVGILSAVFYLKLIEKAGNICYNISVYYYLYKKEQQK